MSWALRKTDKAIDDLTDIHDYIALDNKAAAEKVIVTLLDAFDRTADYPEIGRVADEIRPGFRLLVKGSYLLLYRVIAEERTVELVRVIHSARNWPTLFDS